MSDWLLIYYPPSGADPVTKPLAAWGLSQLRKNCRSFAPDLLTFTAPVQALDAPILFENYARIQITHPNGQNWFTGIVTAQPRSGRGSAESGTYTVSGPWWIIDRLTFQEQWLCTNGVDAGLIATTKTRTIIGQNIDGTKMNLGAMTSLVLNYVLVAAATAGTLIFPDGSVSTPFIPFTIGTVAPSITIPFDEVTDMFCGQIIKHMMKYSPDCVAYFDYTASPPVLYFKQRPSLPAVGMSIFNPDGPCSGFNADPCYDLQVTSVHVKYEQTNVIDGASYDTLIIDKYPLTALDNDIRSLVTTQSLLGGREAFQKQPVTVTLRPVAAADLIAMDWVLRKEPWLKDKDSAGNQVWDYGHMSVALITTTLDPADPQAITPDPDFPALTTLVAELTSGAIADWMKESDGVYAAKVNVDVLLTTTSTDPATLALFTYNYDAPDIPTAPGEGYLRFNIGLKATNAETKTYQELTDFSESEPAPVGVAQALYNSLNPLHYKGSIQTIEQECSDWCSIGNVLNTTDGKAEWQTMQALIIETMEEVETGTTTIKFGPPTVLNLQDYTEMARAVRGRLPSYRLDNRTSAKTPGVQVDGHNHGADNTNAKPPALLVPKPYQIFVRNNAGVWQAKISTGRLYKPQGTSGAFTLTNFNTWINLSLSGSGDAFWIEGTVSNLACTAAAVHSIGNGNTDFDTTGATASWDSSGKGDLVYNNGTSQSQTKFRTLLATVIADLNGRPIVQPVLTQNMILTNASVNGIPAIVPVPYGH